MKRDEKGWKEIKKDVENDIVHVSNCPLVKRYDCACQKVKMSWFEIPECLVHFNFRVKLHSHAFSFSYLFFSFFRPPDAESAHSQPLLQREEEREKQRPRWKKVVR